MTHLSLIWAMSENRLIGADNTLPWRLPKDMRHFMDVTMGKPVVMGRKTFESMKAPLPGRTNVVLTRDTNYQRDGISVVHTLGAGIQLGEQVCARDGQDEIMVIGGADIYALALPRATRLYLTWVHAHIEGDVFFPEFALDTWREVSAEFHPADERHTAAFTIAVYARG